MLRTSLDKILWKTRGDRGDLLQIVIFCYHFLLLKYLSKMYYSYKGTRNLTKIHFHDFEHSVHIIWRRRHVYLHTYVLKFNMSNNLVKNYEYKSYGCSAYFLEHYYVRSVKNDTCAAQIYPILLCRHWK